MGGLYKVINPDGSISFTDVPQGAGNFSAHTPGRAATAPGTPEKSPAEQDFELTKKAIKKASTAIPTVEQYLAYLDYLRHHSPLRFDQVLQELQKKDPKTWLKLQKYPQFKPLRDTALGLKAGERHLAAAVGLATGNITGSAQKWMEGTLKELMKRDRFGPFSEVLSEQTPGKAKTVRPALAADMAYNAAQGKAAAKGLKASISALRASAGVAIGRLVGGPTDVMVEFLNPERASDVAVAALALKARKLYERGVLDEEGWATAQQLLSSGKYVEMQAHMQAAIDRFVHAR